MNLDPHHLQAATAEWPLWEYGSAWDAGHMVEDLLIGERWAWHGARNYVELGPAIRAAHVCRVVRLRPVSKKASRSPPIAMKH